MIDHPATTYDAQVRARHRAAAIDRIADRFAAGVLADLPEVFLIIVERALDRDMSGVCQFSRDFGYRVLSHSPPPSSS
ncbi:MAG: hypothetical protein P9F75_07445 [Candidatus Contendobacter sp.]|nr:hypothetical protein [Candidatus Contendobacter sp.]